jgi:hypothetical protein
MGSNSLGCTAGANHLVIVQQPPVMTANLTNTTVCAGGTVNLSASGASGYTWSTGSNTPNILVTANTNTVFSVTGGHNTNSCVATKNFTIDAISVVLGVSGSTAVCMGSQITMSVQSSSNINWSPSGGTFQFPTVQPTVTTIFTVTAKVATLSLSCPASNTVLVTINPNPTITAFAARPVMCRYETNVLTPSGASTYTLANQVTSSTVNYTATITGAITLTMAGVDANGCRGTGSLKVQVNACNSLDEFQNPHGIKVYPVPAAGTLFVEGRSGCTLFLVNLAGQAIRTVILNAENGNKAALSDLPAGLYLLRTADGKGLGKVVIE